MENFMSLASKSAMELNDDAITFLQEGDHAKTTKALFDAVACLESLIPDQQIENPEMSNKEQQQMKSQSLPQIECIPIPEDLSDSDTEQNLDSFPYFNRALSVQIEQNGPIKFESYTRVSSILLYNMALSHHHESVGRNSSAELANALKLYELSYYTIERVKDKLKMDDVFILLLGLFFNMANIHQKLFNSVECQHCVDWLQRAMASREIATLSDEEYFFFSTNISLLSFQMPNWAPAA